MIIANENRETVGSEIPKPVLTFAVGVTGHRAEHLLSDHIDRVGTQIARVFDAIDSACLEEKARHPDLFANVEPQIRLFTSLADGTGLIAAARKPGNWEEIAVFPLPEPDYLAVLQETAPKGDAGRIAQDFANARGSVSGVVELLQDHMHDKSPAARSKGFARSRDFVLRQIDILVAVWDGGGAVDPRTAEFVARALEADIPVVWIASEKDQAPWLIKDMVDVGRPTDLADAVLGPVAESVRTTLGIFEAQAALREPWKTHRREVSALQRLHDFLAEKPTARTHFFPYSWLKNLPFFWQDGLLSVDCGSLKRTIDEWKQFLDQAPSSGPFSTKLRDILLTRYALVDMLATFYANRYRSTYVLAYFLSVMAVGLALLGFVDVPPEMAQALQALAKKVHFPQQLLKEFHDPQENAETLLRIKLGLVIGELICVGGILGFVAAGSWWRWHDRWLDYRALAEMLRHLRFLGLLGEYETRAYAEAAARPGAGWIVWYWRATMREVGAATGALDPEHQRKLLRAVEPAEIDAQIDYHARNVSDLRRLHLILHWSGIGIFGLVIVFLVLDFAGLWNEVQWLVDRARWLGFASAFLPALGAALAGIRFTGDFEGFAERSAETGAALEKLKEKYAHATDLLDFDETARTLGETARIMAGDITGWQALYGRKILVLPG